MPSKVKNHLAQLAKVEPYIAQFQKLSNIHERVLTEHNDQLDYSWKDGYEKGVRDANATHQAHAETNLQIKKNLSVQVADLQKQNDDLARQNINLRYQLEIKPEPVVASLGFKTYTGPVVENWRDSWKWISNWCFGLIVFFATTPIPPEVLAVLPENVRYYFIAFTAFCGFVGRYINQSKPVALPPINAGDADV